MRIRVYKILTLSCVAAMVAVFASCSGTADPQNWDSPATPALAGTYALTLTRRAATCSPQQLPPPLSADTSLYTQIPIASSALQIRELVHQQGADLSVVPLDASGQQLSALAYGGTVSQNGGLLSVRTLQFVEGARQGGHSFFVSRTTTDTAEYLLDVLTPPGVGIDIVVISSGSDIYTFMDGSATGAVFTTCVVAQLESGSRVAR